jgi:hypothetical protein
VAFSIPLLFAVLGACSSNERLLLYIDPYEGEVLDGQGLDAAAIRQLLPKDVDVRVEVPPLQMNEAEAVMRFQEEIERMKPGWIYLSAAHPFDPEALISRYPNVVFFREWTSGRDLGQASPVNRIALVYDRERANYEAGRAIAALLGDEDFLKRIGGGSPELEKPRVGVLAAVRTDFVQREIDAFQAGFSELEDPRRLEIKEIGNLSDRVKARRLLDRMREEAVAIVLLKTYVLSGFCLEYLTKETGVAIVEGPIPDRAYGDTVLLKLVDDFAGALQQMGKTIDEKPQAVGGGRVTVPVRLQWNQTYRSVTDRVLEGVNRQ